MDDIEVQRRLRELPDEWADLEVPLGAAELLTTEEKDRIHRVIPETFMHTCHQYNITPFEGVLAIIRRRREIEDDAV